MITPFDSYLIGGVTAPKHLKLLKKLFGGHRPAFMPIRCNLQGTLATLGRSSCKITSGRGRKQKRHTIDIADCLYTCQLFNSNKLFGTLTIHLKGHNRYQLYYMVQYMLYASGYVSFQKQELPFKMPHNQKQNINHHQPSNFTNKKKITPAQFPSISQDSPRFSNGKNPAHVVFSSFFSGFGWLVSRRCRSAPRFRSHRGSSELGHFPGGSSGQESLKQTFGTWRRLRRFPPCRCVRGKCVWLVVGWWLTKTGWFFGGTGRKMRKIWEREVLFCLFFGGDEEWKVSNQKKLYDHVPNFFVLWVVVEKWQLEQ